MVLYTNEFKINQITDKHMHYVPKTHFAKGQSGLNPDKSNWF